ncbi:MAG: hypothetical protein AB7S78_02425 [Candidatus Omnitrophota bacterium]
MSSTIRSVSKLFVTALFVLLALPAWSANLTVTSNTTLSTGSYAYDDVTVSNNANLTLEGTVHITADNITVSSGSRITADKKGYDAKLGPGAGSTSVTGGSGGGHGGNGGRTPVLPAKGLWYGSATQPFQMGSGGGGSTCSVNNVLVQSGGRGGGAIWLDVSNTLTISGTLSANGEDVFTCDNRSGGGAGGGIYITTSTLAGSGDIVADGGNGGSSRGGGGGGGRIAVYYESSTFTGSARAKGGHGNTESGISGDGDNGTIGFFDSNSNSFLAGHNWRFQAEDGPFDFDTITLNDASVTTTDGTVTITGTQLIVDGASSLSLNYEDTLFIKDVSVTGTSSIEGNLFLQANNLTIAAGSKVSADSKGFKGGMGVGRGFPNQGQGGGGGGYGGVGGTSDGGVEYGSATAPVDRGSGGAGPGFTPAGEAFVPSSGGAGGGRIQLNIADTLTINGILSAKGGMGLPQGSQSGGGSGGSIFVITEKFTGSGTITANGGNSQATGGSAAGGGGAGGRIAIFHRQTETFSGTPTATGGDGVGDDGDDGTVIVSQTQLAISPASGGDTGQVTALISGSVFEDGATVKLVKSGESDIVGTVTSLENHGLILKAVFDLTDKAQGSWDVVVTQPNNDTLEIEDGFEIEEGTTPDLWIDIVGRGAIRPNRNQTYFVVYGNNSNIDAQGSDIFLQVPGNLEYKIDKDTTIRIAEDPTFIHMIDTVVPARSSATFPVTIKTASGSGSADLSVAISNNNSHSFGKDVEHFTGLNSAFSGTVNEVPDAPPAPTPASYSKLIYGNTDVFPDGIVLYTQMADPFLEDKPFLETGIVIGNDAVFNYEEHGVLVVPLETLRSGSIVVDGRTIEVDLRFGIRPAPEEEMPAVAEKVISNFISLQFLPLIGERVSFCSSSSGACAPAPVMSCIGYVLHLIYGDIVVNGGGYSIQMSLEFVPNAPLNKLYNIEEIFKYWLKDAAPDELILYNQLTTATTEFIVWWGGVIRIKHIAIGSPLDPNEKFGPVGVGEERYVSKKQSLNYSIYFENIESATAAAQEVIITDELDDTYLDFDTFSLGPVGFGDQIIVPPSGLKEYITEIDLRPDNDLIVRLEASLNTGSGVVTWKFTALDPNTHALTDDPEAGFLPPNITHPEGEGFVLFSIRPKDDVSTGDEIENEASIVFDTNSPIITNTWLNTIDATKPSSSMNSMDSEGTLTSFDISWSGSDAHSGIKEYTLYISEDFGPYTETLTTTGTLTSFVGVNGSTYSFYTIATDQVGNREDAPVSPDLTITINDPMQEPCTINTDYIVGVTCFGTTTVANDSQLEDYLIDYDYNGTYYKHLHVNYNITMDNMDIHSPCDITIASSKTLTGERICIDGRKKVDSASNLTVNGTFVSFISELGDVTVGNTSTITASNLLIQGYKVAEIPISAVVNVAGPILIKSIGNTSTSKARMGQDSVISAQSVRLESVREASTGPGMQLTVEDELEIISTGTDASSKAVTGLSSEITAGSLEMSADKAVEIGNGSTVEISGNATLISTGSSSTSDVTIKLDTIVSTDSLDITAGDDAVLQGGTEITVTNNFHMQAATTNDCSISGSATISAGSESGNCL